MRFASLALLFCILTSLPQTAPAPVARPDASRLVRVWDIGKLDRSTYTRKRTEGARMLMAATHADPSRQPVLSSQGFTLLLSEQPLARLESAPGVWDLSALDTAAKEAQTAGFAYALSGSFAYPPEWYRERVRFTRLQCLEHGEKIEAFSPWDEKYALQTDRALGEIARRLSERNPTAIWLGGCGQDGRAGIFTRQADPQHGPHAGWWCGDPTAVADFRAAMMRKYRDLDVLNAAWETQFRRPSEMLYPAAPSPSRRHWLDFVHWYRGSITGQTIRLAEQARRSWPDTLPVIPIAASLNPKGGIDLTELATAVGDSADISLPVAPPGSPSELVTRLTAAACRFYRCSFWAESVSPEAGPLSGRMFTAVSSGAKGFLDRFPLAADSAEAFYRNVKQLRVARPIVDVALLYPTTSHLLNGGEVPPILSRACSELRDVIEFDVVDERMIADDALKGYRLLVMCEGTVYESEALKRIEDWVNDGGVLTAYDFGKVETVEGDREWFAGLFGHVGRLRPAPSRREEVMTKLADVRNEWARPFGKGWTVYFPARKEQMTSYYEVVRYLVYRMSELDNSKRDAPALDIAWDGVYTSVSSDRILYYNAGPGIKELKGPLPAALFKEGPAVSASPLTIAVGGIGSVPLVPPPIELLLQCEKFTQPGPLRPQNGGSFSPGGGPTHMLIPVGGSITTRFQCDASGRYRVFYRAERRGGRAGAEIEVEGKVLRGVTAPDGPRMDSATLFAGVLDLERGVRNLTVRPRKGEDIRADYVVLTTDSGIGGYTFPPARASGE